MIGSPLTVIVRVWHAGQQRLRLENSSWPSTAAKAVALAVDQRLVPLETMDDVAEESPQGLTVHQGIDAADGVDAGGLGAEEAPQPRGEAEVRGEGGGGGGGEGEKDWGKVEELRLFFKR